MSQSIAGYQLRSQIGFGPLGVVWEADGPEGAVAVTVVPVALAGSADIRAALTRAAGGAMGLTHPGLARCLGFREDGEQLLLVAELLQGEALATRLERKPALTGDEVRRLSLALAEALAYLHGHSIVHGGVCPANIFLTADGKAILLQAGLARVHTEAMLRLGGSPAVDPLLLAPELAKSNTRLTAKSDIWSLGETLQRCRPQTAAESAPAGGAGAPPDTLAGLIARCREANPADRPAAAALVQEATGRPVVLGTIGDRRHIQRRVLWGLAAGGCLLLVGLIASGWYLYNHQELFAGMLPRTIDPAEGRRAAVGNRSVVTPAAAGEPQIAGQLRQARIGAPAVFVDGKVYIFGGSDGSSPAASECYDPAAHRSTRLATELMARTFHAAEAADGVVYIVGGMDLDGVTGAMEIFVPAAGKVTTGSPMPTPRFNASAAILDGKMYVAGGSTGAATDLTDALEIYDLATDRWTRGAPLPAPRQTELVAWGRKIYALGGYPGDGSADNCWSYNPEQDAWSELPALSYPVSAHRAVALGSELYTFGSYDKLDQVLRFKNRNWERIAVAFLPRRHAGIACDRDRVWILGGTTDGKKALADVQEFTARELAAAPVR